MSDTPSPARVLACSYAAATGALLINFPLDTIKTRVQAAPDVSIIQSVRTLYREAGVRGFYRGVSASLISSSAARAMSMGLYASFVPKYAGLFHIPMQSPADRPTVPVFFAGLTAGAFSCVLTGPFEFTKTASQVESLIVNQRQAAPARAVAAPMAVPSPLPGLAHDSMTMARPIGPARAVALVPPVAPGPAPTPAPARPVSSTPRAPGRPASPQKISALRTVRNLRRRGGWKQLYGGVEYHCMRDSVGSAIYFSVYEALKKTLSRNRVPGEPPSPVAVAVAGGACGAVSWLAVYPIDTMKSEYQRDLYSRTLIPTSLEYNETVVRRPKFRFSLKMYRGLGFSLMRTSLNGVCLFSLFEYFMYISS